MSHHCKYLQGNILLRPQSLEFGVNKHITWSTVSSASVMINISVKTNDNAAAGVMHGLSHTANVQHRHPQIIISCLKTESIANMIVMSSCWSWTRFVGLASGRGLLFKIIYLLVNTNLFRNPIWRHSAFISCLECGISKSIPDMKPGRRYGNNWKTIERIQGPGHSTWNTFRYPPCIVLQCDRTDTGRVYCYCSTITILFLSAPLSLSASV